MGDAATFRDFGMLQVAAVFDGHGGKAGVDNDGLARRAAEIVPTLLNAHLHQLTDAQRADPRMVRKCIKDCFGASRRPGWAPIHAGLPTVAEELARDPAWKSQGATAVVSVRMGNQLYIANLGDSRAMLVTKNGCQRLTIDQTVDNPREMAKIDARGGRAAMARGQMPITRRLGETEHFGMGKRPQVTCVDLGELKKQHPDATLVLACDGICDTMHDKVLGNFVQRRLNDRVAPAQIAAELVTAAHERVLRSGSSAKGDNLTAMVLPL